MRIKVNLKFLFPLALRQDGDICAWISRNYRCKHSALNICATTHIRVCGFCRLLRVYSRKEQYNDNQLPSYLSLLATCNEKNHIVIE
ncbi:unnamed protein product [Albugo candida]|uniref:Uncharacterized protein n=1 Tax=Albugo candida TaxID=65357 RepID=A0A024G4A7_9STRA|nr:unnamed protein product [Albugo candida]|eukprot:CCI41694.1 unnamed protein product [Albugo candida]